MSPELAPGHLVENRSTYILPARGGRMKQTQAEPCWVLLCTSAPILPAPSAGGCAMRQGHVKLRYCCCQPPVFLNVPPRRPLIDERQLLQPSVCCSNFSNADVGPSTACICISAARLTANHCMSTLLHVFPIATHTNTSFPLFFTSIQCQSCRRVRGRGSMA